MKSKKMKKEFYDTFQLGIELEMEVPSCEAQTDQIMEVKSDGSIRQQKANTRAIEIINQKTFKSQADETAFFEHMKTKIVEFESDQSKEKIFAYLNRTCGTHIHFSFKNKPQSMMWLFDTLEFEKDFFLAYMRTFKSDKFMERINGQYCRAPYFFAANGETAPKAKDIESNIKSMNIVTFSDEKARIGGSDARYRWLNMNALQRRTGAELRLFPHMQTYSGVNTVLEFTKKVINDYYWKAETQQRLKLMEFYEEKLKNSSIRTDKLNSMKKLIYDVLRVEQRPKDEYSGEIRLLLASWVSKQPKLINQCYNEIL